MIVRQSNMEKSGSCHRHPHCQSDSVLMDDKASNGKARFSCQQSDQGERTFLQTYECLGCLPAVKWQIVEMTLSGSEVRNTAPGKARWYSL
jgi:hypothetical protein